MTATRSAYFAAPTPACPTFEDDSEWQPLIDGAAYFTALDGELTGLGAGDTVLISGLSLDPDLDLCGRRPVAPGHDPLAGRLARLAAAGVEVRVLLAGKALAGLLPVRALRIFRTNAATAARLRRSGVAALVDRSGALLGCHHDKFVVIARRGRLTAFIGGIDLVDDRFDAAPHAALRLRGRRWGWHDAVVRLHGPAAGGAWSVFAERWLATARRSSHRVTPVNLRPSEQESLPADGVSVRVLRSNAKLPDGAGGLGVHEAFEALSTAIGAARRYVYLEDQYLSEAIGGRRGFELYPYLVAAAGRGVKIILVGSGVRDPDDIGVHRRPANARLNRDLRRRLFEPLDATMRGNVAVYRIENVTVHSKLVLVDDVFACIGSANMFSRSMSGVDVELSTAVTASTSLVRDLRVRLWAEHLRTPLTAGVPSALTDLDCALGIWNRSWAPADAGASLWLVAGSPPGFAPTERVLLVVAPSGDPARLGGTSGPATLLADSQSTD